MQQHHHYNKYMISLPIGFSFKLQSKYGTWKAFMVLAEWIIRSPVPTGLFEKRLKVNEKNKVIKGEVAAGLPLGNSKLWWTQVQEATQGPLWLFASPLSTTEKAVHVWVKVTERLGELMNVEVSKQASAVCVLVWNGNPPAKGNKQSDLAPSQQRQDVWGWVSHWVHNDTMRYSCPTSSYDIMCPLGPD